MLRLSKLTDYAVVVLSAMAHRSGETHTASCLADRTTLPAPTVQKLLKLLAKGGVVEGLRGATGGYRLARAPEAISVADIIAAVDGPIALTDCVDGSEGTCGVESLCPMRGNWDRVNRAIRTALEGVSLAAMATPPSFMDPVGADRQAADRAGSERASWPGTANGSHA